MTLADRFAEFFAALNGTRPYRWQRELVVQVAATGRWPDIAAPTGSGKSAVIDAHVFLVAEHACGYLSVRPPRRLVLVAPRRVLVDDQFRRATAIAERLLEALNAGDPVVAEAARGLLALKTGCGDGTESPLGVWMLRGGIRPDTGWRGEPAACQIICTTPQMWGSRLLLRGYGASLRSRNVEAGLLGQDAVAIVDEAHLHTRLVETACAVRDLDCGPVPLQVVAMSATQPAFPGQRGLTNADLDDPSLRRRVLARKTLQVLEVPGTERELRRALIERALAAREAAGPDSGAVGVFVNAVPTALAVAAELRHHGEVVVVCGRLRPADVHALRETRPGLLSAEGDPSVGFLVATQSLEVGVDLDLPAMVTTLAPANALAQRAGRLNRSGRHDELDPTFSVLVPVDDAGEPVLRGTWIGPYGEQDLVDARGWLAGLAGSIAPWHVAASEVPVPASSPLPRLRRIDLETLAMSSDPLAGDPEPDLYLHEPEQETPAVAVIARRHLSDGLDPQVTAAMLLACPPRPHEIASLRPGPGLQRIVDLVRQTAWVVRGDDGTLQALPLTMAEDVRPGETLVVPDGAMVCTAGVLGLGDVSGASGPFADVLEVEVPGSSAYRVRRLPAADVGPILTEDPVLGSRTARRRLADVLGDASLAAQLRTSRLADLELAWCGVDDEEGIEGLLVVRDMRRGASFAPRIVASDPVLLDRHQADVEARLAAILGALRLQDGEVPSRELLVAARTHDMGKAHPRFQARMGAGHELLAKPRPGHRPDQGDGWRHEQLSAAFAAAESDGDPLTVAVVAAHHGCGRALFDRGEHDLLASWDDCDQETRAWVARLYGEGARYEELRDCAQRKHGVHGLCWLEALLCCADRQISAEGR